jgi:hypothetical protein
MSFFFSARRALRPAGALAAALTMAGCSNDILNVGTPDVISADVLGGSLGATTLRNGAIQDFTQSFSGSIDAYATSSGNLGDEIQTTDTFADRYNTDQRNQSELVGGAINTTYNNLQLARTGLTSAIIAWTKVKPASKDSLSEMYAIRALAENLFAEGYCAGVPFSSVAADGTFQYGQPLTTVQMLATAGSTADSANTLAGAANYKNLAAIIKGRILVNQGQFAQAATAVSAVPTSYKYFVYHSSATSRQNNGLYAAAFTAGSRYTVGTKEGTVGLDYLTTPADPRVPWTASTRVGFDGTSRNLPVEQKYNAINAPIAIADGIEARLIEAEARLQGGAQSDRDAVFTLLNTLRATGLSTAIAPIAAAPTTQDAAVDLLFKERAFWMWLTGHRLGDMRRLVRQYKRDQATVYPTGAMVYRPGNNYGAQTVMVIPFAERNNPNFKGCIDMTP